MPELTRFAGAETEQDFVEAPSQNLEHWVWEPEVLDRFAAHWETGEKMPREMIDGMVAAKQLNSGVTWLRQVFYSALDMSYCGPGGDKDTDAVLAELHPICGFPPMPDTHFQAGFGHHLRGPASGCTGANDDRVVHLGCHLCLLPLRDLRRAARAAN